MSWNKSDDDEFSTRTWRQNDKKWGDCAIDRSPDKCRQLDDAYLNFEVMYFNEDNVYDEVNFERGFRMPGLLFERIYNGIKRKRVFVNRKDGTGKRGIHPKKKVISALRIFGYGSSYDAQDELF